LKSAAERISRLVRLTARERALLVRAWWQLLLVDVALRVVPLTWMLPRGAAAIRRTSVPPERVAWLLDVARRYSPARASCLIDSIVLVRLLRAEGLDARLNVGVARGDGTLRAHAWVEYRGQILFGRVEGEIYTRLASAGAPPRAL
jgi:hypothetical protein